MIFVIVLIGWTISLCAHEFAHALVAYKGGDWTVREKGYLTFNPLRYTHPLYSLIMPLVFLLLGGLGLPGGAVYIETWRLRSRRWVTATALAGPLANMLLALLLALVLRLAPAGPSWLRPGLAFLALLQVSAVVLNLIPIPSLDGYRAVAPYLSYDLEHRMSQAGRWALWAFFLILWYVPFANALLWRLVYAIAGGVGIPVGLALAGLQGFQFWR